MALKRLRVGWIDVDDRISVYLTMDGWFVVYVSGIDRTRGDKYYVESLGDQVRLIERFGTDDATKIINALL